MIMDGFSDPIQSLDGRYLYFIGGGHSDSSINCIIKLDLYTMTYSLEFAPTPPSCYPPSYTAPNSSIVYPSGYAPGFFAILADMTDSRDFGFAAPARAQSARHRYTSGVMDKRGVIHFFYGTYGQYDTVSHQWLHLSDVDIGAQLYAIDTKYGNEPLGQGVATAYDSVTDLIMVSMVPGDEEAAWRHGFFLFNPNTLTIVSGSLHQGQTLSRAAMNLMTSGRYAIGLMTAPITDGSNPVDCANGWRFNWDTHSLEFIRVQGDTFSYTMGGVNAETAPANVNSLTGAIRRWNYQDEINNFYDVNPTPVSGSGTSGDPYMLQQTRTTASGTAPSTVVLNYRRPFFYAGCWIYPPAANSNIYVVKP